MSLLSSRWPSKDGEMLSPPTEPLATFLFDFRVDDDEEDTMVT